MITYSFVDLVQRSLASLVRVDMVSLLTKLVYFFCIYASALSLKLIFVREMYKAVEVQKSLSLSLRYRGFSLTECIFVPVLLVPAALHSRLMNSLFLWILDIAG